MTESSLTEITFQLAQKRIEFSVDYPTAKSFVVTVKSEAINNDQLKTMVGLGADISTMGQLRILGNMEGEEY